MATNDIRDTTTTQLDSGLPATDIAPQMLDSPGDTATTNWDNTNWTKYLGYYKTQPEIKQPVIALQTWAFGKGWEADDTTTVTLNNLTGWGEDSFQSIIENLLMQKKINGDAYAEIIRNERGALINLKPLNPGSMRTVVNKEGLIIRYEQLGRTRKRAIRRFTTEQIFHISNDRIGDEIHGTSSVEAVEWVIIARKEAMEDWKRISHRSTIRVLYVDEDAPSKLKTLRDQYKDAIKNGEVLILPGTKKDMELDDVNLPPIAPFLEWIQYLEGFFYQVFGVPRVIATAEGSTEASSKVGFLSFEPVYVREQRLMETDIKSQLGLDIIFNRPPSLKDNVQGDEEANTGQTNFQPNELNPAVQE